MHSIKAHVGHYYRSKTTKNTKTTWHTRRLYSIYRVRHNYGKQGLMERYIFNSLSAINLTWD